MPVRKRMGMGGNVLDEIFGAGGMDFGMDPDMDDMPFGFPGMGGNPKADLLRKILGAAMGNAMSHQESMSLEELLDRHDCDNCHKQGNCPKESDIRKAKLRAEEIMLDVTHLKDGNHIAADAAIAGKDAEIGHLKNSVVGLRLTIDKLTKKHEAEVKQLTDEHKAEAEQAREAYGLEIRLYNERHVQDGKHAKQLMSDLHAATSQLDAVRSVLSNGNGQKSPEILAALRKQFNIPAPAKAKKPDAPTDTSAAESATA